MLPLLRTTRATALALGAVVTLQMAGAVLSPSANAGITPWLATTNVNVRSGPGTQFSKIGLLIAGNEVVKTGDQGTWSIVNFKGKKGYISTEFLYPKNSAASDIKPNPSAGIAYATSDLNVRVGPGTIYRVLSVAPQGTKFSLAGRTVYGFSAVYFEDSVYWVSSSYLASDPNQTRPKNSAANEVKVKPTPKIAGTRYTTDYLNIRSTSNPDSTIVAVAPRGAALPITGNVKNGMAEVIYQNSAFWASLQYLSPTPPKEPGSSTSSGSLNHGYSEGLDKTNPSIKTVTQYIWANYPQIKTMYGWRPGYDDHTAGRAVDVMLPYYKSNSALGWEIAKFFRRNAKRFNIKYIIFQQQIWNIQRDREGWRRMADRGSDTANHYDHVHLNSW